MVETPHFDVCLIEPEAMQRNAVARAVRAAGFTVAAAADVQSGMEFIQVHQPKVVLVDYSLPDGNGVDICRRVRCNPEYAAIYLIFATAFGSHELRDRAIAAGADDYLSQPFDERDLIARIQVGMRMWAMHDDLRRAAITDGLTDLYNHDHLNRMLEQEVARSRRYGHPLSFIMMDIDFFKAVNDTYGHMVGNEVLVQIARMLRECAREVDIIGRFGGEEFAVILPEATSQEASQAAERMRLAIMESLEVAALRDHQVTASFGVADLDDPRASNAAQLVDLADRAMYLAKHRGRNQVVLASELDGWDEPIAAIQTSEVESLRRRLVALSTQAKDVFIQSVESLLQALDERDPYSAWHSRNTSFYAEQIARQMGCSQATASAVRTAGLLHDIGKVGIPDRTLLKQTPLTRLERSLMDQVPVISARIVDRLRILESEIQIIRHQREYYDGSGFPSGLKGQQIPIGSRILLVADAFDAMTTDRVYRQRRSIEETMREMQQLSGRQFDPRAVVALRQVIERDRDIWENRIASTVEELRPVSPARTFPRTAQKPLGGKPA